jgi:hypothetical protein
MPVSFSTTKSVRERILEDVVSTLQGITLANGYHVDMGSVQRYDTRGFRAKAMPTCIVQAGEQEPKDGPMPMTTKEMTVWIHALIRRDEDSATTVDEDLETLLLDIETAMMQDRTRGGIAIHTEPADAAPLDHMDKAGAVYPGMAIGFRITYRHHFQDPTLEM